MKLKFIECSLNKDIIIPEEIINKLPKNVCVLTTVQYIKGLSNIIRQLKKNKINVETLKLKHSKYKGQMLGCSFTTEALNIFSEAILFIGDGLFHPKIIKLKTEKPVYAFNPLTEELTEVKESDVKNIKDRLTGALLKYHDSKNIGILVSIKPGQNKLEEALRLKEEIKKENKNAFVLLCETLDFNDLINYTFIDVFVNTLCPRIGFDDNIRINKPIINYTQLSSK